MSKIWITWNPITWCTKYSDWCKNCYAKSMAEKFQKLWVAKYKNWFELTFHEDTLSFPEKTKKPSIIFPNSMTDLFHENIPFENLKKIFEIMNKNNQHLYSILTKRSKRLLELSEKLEIWDHIRVWVTVESNKYYERISDLKKVKCKKRYICVEPILSSLDDINLDWIDWVTWWTETWPSSRVPKDERIINLNKKCSEAWIPFSFKHRDNEKKSIYYDYPIEFKNKEEENLNFTPNKTNKNQLELDF